MRATYAVVIALCMVLSAQADEDFDNFMKLTEGFLCEARGDREGAVAIYDGIISPAPGYLPAQECRATALARLERFADARRNADLVAASNPLRGELIFSRICVIEGKRDEALAHCQAALKLDPRSAESHVELAGVRIYRRELPDAKDSFDNAIDYTEPDNLGMLSRFYLVIVHALLRSGGCFSQFSCAWTARTM